MVEESPEVIDHFRQVINLDVVVHGQRYDPHLPRVGTSLQVQDGSEPNTKTGGGEGGEDRAARNGIINE